MTPAALAVRTLSVLSLALALAACGDDAATPAPATDSATAAPADAPADAPTDAPAAAPTPAVVLDDPIPRDAIATRLERVSDPVHVVADDQLEFDVVVHNDGSADLTSDGSRPVQLGVTLAGPDGVDAAPGVRDFGRVRLPLIEAGDSARVTVRVPVEPLLGLTVRLELVQELVAWFGLHHQEPTLDVGTFARCADGKALCDAGGQPLPTR